MATNAQVKAYTRRISKLTDERNELRDRLARVVEWARSHATPGRDYACAECDPDGPINKPGFRCVWHEFLAAAKGEP